MLVLVCGDREWTDHIAIRDRLILLPPDVTIIHGNCRGADLIAAEEAGKLGFEVIPFPADWAKHGRAAGPIRNRKMLDQKPVLVLAFHRDLDKSRGTKDCVTEAGRRGIKTEVFKGKRSK